ncbi:MAG: DUF4430 domain-containing protein [Candidatus Paceibacterota bacterium]
MTKKQKTKKLILIIFLLIICSILIYAYKQPNNDLKSKNLTTDPSSYQGEGQEENTYPLDKNKLISKTSGVTTLFINDTKYEIEIKEEISVYDLMTELQNEGEITFKDKNYSGMGKFIEEINNIKNGEKYWIYYVNDKKAEIGVSNYKINNGDIVSWKYETY